MNTRPLRADEMVCPECGKIAVCESVDVGVGLVIRGDFSCECGWHIDADGMMNVGSPDDYLNDIEQSPISSERAKATAS